jgi:TfoX/Sxy family transcriptional regulator of competence genes
MAYNSALEGKIEEAVRGWRDVQKKKMFGGICYLMRGNMCFGIHKDSLIVRTGVEAAERELKKGKVRPFDITGKTMNGWVMVDETGWAHPQELKRWLELGKSFAETLPAKPPKG